MVAAARLSQATQERLLHLVESGEFETADEAVIVALDALEELRKAERLVRKLETGLQSVQDGRTVLYTPEWRKASLDDILRRYEAGERADPEYAFELTED